MSNHSATLLLKNRLFFLSLVCVVVAVVLFLNRDALWSHPAHREPAHPVPAWAPAPDSPVSSLTLAVFDTETTGVDPFIHRIVELAVVKLKDGEAIDSRTWLLNPQRFIPEEASTIHGITGEMVADAPLFGEVYDEFLAFVEGCVLVAHNAQFDINFINQECARAQVPPPEVPVFDSLRLFRTWFPDRSSYTLESMAEELEITEDAFHRAEADSLYAGLIFYEGLQREEKELTFAELQAIHGEPLAF